MFRFKSPALLLLIVVVFSLLSLVGHGQGGGGNPFTRDPRRSFYVTKTFHNGSQASTACAVGYHMASLWELLDPSNLRYDTQLGSTWADSGFGPPTASASEARVRTGGPPSNSETVGLGNCNAWTSASQDDFGTVIRLDFPWEDPGKKISPWLAFSGPCSAQLPVWCMQD